jgi:hypothetical protein
MFGLEGREYSGSLVSYLSCVLLLVLGLTMKTIASVVRHNSSVLSFLLEVLQSSLSMELVKNQVFFANGGCSLILSMLFFTCSGMLCDLLSSVSLWSCLFSFLLLGPHGVRQSLSFLCVECMLCSSFLFMLATSWNFWCIDVQR